MLIPPGDKMASRPAWYAARRSAPIHPGPTQPTAGARPPSLVLDQDQELGGGGGESRNLLPAADLHIQGGTTLIFFSFFFLARRHV